MSSGTVRKNKSARSERTRTDATRPPKTSPIAVTAANATGSTLTVTFNGPVTLKGVPQYTTDVAGATAVSATMTGGNSIAILFSASISAATAMNIPYEEPAVRNASGGFVSTSTFPC